MLLQVSVVGEPGTALHSVPVPSTRQTTLPARTQNPLPAVHDEPSVGNASSTALLQSSSRLLQSSAAGVIWPGHVVPQEPDVQICVPARQTPTPCVPGVPV